GGAEAPFAVAKASSLFTGQAGGPGGFEGSIAKYLTPHVALKGMISGFFNNQNGRSGVMCQDDLCVTGQPFGVHSNALYFLAGPEFRIRNRSHLSPIVHGLLGVVRSSSEFSTNGSQVSFSDRTVDHGVAAMLGGG